VTVRHDQSDATGRRRASLLRSRCGHEGLAADQVARCPTSHCRRHVKTDPGVAWQVRPIDAYAAARAALTATRTTVPKAGDRIVEAIRALRAARRGAVKARTQTTNQLKSLLVTAPPEVRERLQGLKTSALPDRCPAQRCASHRQYLLERTTRQSPPAEHRPSTGGIG
jgi:hypothetical protein